MNKEHTKKYAIYIGGSSILKSNSEIKKTDDNKDGTNQEAISIQAKETTTNKLIPLLKFGVDEAEIYLSKASVNTLDAVLKESGVLYKEVDFLSGYFDYRGHYLYAFKTPKGDTEVKKSEKEFRINKAIFFWDGLNIETLLDIIFALPRTDVQIVNALKGNVETIESIDDLYKLLPERQPLKEVSDYWPHYEEPCLLMEQANELFTLAFTNEGVSAHIKNQFLSSLNKKAYIELLLNSPLPLDYKMEKLHKFTRFEQLVHDLIDVMQEENTYKNPRDIWSTLVRWSYAECIKVIESALSNPQTEYITDKDGQRIYLTGVNFETGRAYDDLYTGRYYLTLDVPFVAGDIVNLDCAEFGKPCNALILDSDNGTAVASIVYKSENNKWVISRLNIGRKWGDKHDALVPLYRLHKAEEVGEDESQLKEMREIILADNSKASEFRHIIRATASIDALTDVELDEIIGFVKQGKSDD